MYAHYMRRANFEKALNTLIGIIKGVKADRVINENEISELQNWCLLQREFREKHPFNEIIPLVERSIADGVLTQDEIDDILFVCNAFLRTNFSPYYDVITSGIATLHGILHGILSDNVINAEELMELRGWMQDHYYLESVYPYDEVYSLIHKVLQDGHVDEEEQKLLKAFFGDFVDTQASVNINKSEIEQLKREIAISGICALGPNIEIPDRTFCFTGESSRATRAEMEKIVLSRGGQVSKSVTKNTDFLIVGDNGNPCWAFSCYGRKIEQAIGYRKKGARIIIAHEVDFWDAVG